MLGESPEGLVWLGIRLVASVNDNYLSTLNPLSTPPEYSLLTLFLDLAIALHKEGQ